MKLKKFVRKKKKCHKSSKIKIINIFGMWDINQ